MRRSTEDFGDKVTGHLLTHPYHCDKAIFCGRGGRREGGRGEERQNEMHTGIAEEGVEDKRE